MYAGIFYAIAIVAAWAALFAPYLTKARHMILRSVLAPIVVTAVTCLISIKLPNLSLFTFILLLIVGIGGVKCSKLLIPQWHTLVHVFSICYALFVVPGVFTLTRIAYKMWHNAVDPGAVRHGEVFKVAHCHSLLIIMSFILSAFLGYLLLKKQYHHVKISAALCLLFCLFGGVAFYQTVPRAGDEGMMLWFLLVPGGILAGMILLLISIIALMKMPNQLPAVKGRLDVPDN